MCGLPNITRKVLAGNIVGEKMSSNHSSGVANEENAANRSDLAVVRSTIFKDEAIDIIFFT